MGRETQGIWLVHFIPIAYGSSDPAAAYRQTMPVRHLPHVCGEPYWKNGRLPISFRSEMGEERDCY